MIYLTGKDYPHLCPYCRAAIDSVVELCAELPDERASDEEAPCNFIYDHAMMCGGRVCLQEEQEMLDVIMYTYQEVSESGSFSCPLGTDVKHAKSRDDVTDALENWEWVHNRVGSQERDASLLVWVGEHSDVTDKYPDYQVVRKINGVVVWEIA